MSNVIPLSEENQIKIISHLLKIIKNQECITTKKALEKLSFSSTPLSRAAFNAYLYGTVKTPPSRELTLNLLYSVNLCPFYEYHIVNLCGFATDIGNIGYDKYLYTNKKHYPDTY